MLFTHRCQCGNVYESRFLRDSCPKCLFVTLALVTNPASPDYVSAPFTAEWGTDEWIDDAKNRFQRALHEFLLAAQALASETDLQLALARKRDLDMKVDVFIRAKWMQREIIRAVERRVAPVTVVLERSR